MAVEVGRGLLKHTLANACGGPGAPAWPALHASPVGWRGQSAAGSRLRHRGPRVRYLSTSSTSSTSSGGGGAPACEEADEADMLMEEEEEEEGEVGAEGCSEAAPFMDVSELIGCLHERGFDTELHSLEAVQIELTGQRQQLEGVLRRRRQQDGWSDHRTHQLSLELYNIKLLLAGVAVLQADRSPHRTAATRAAQSPSTAEFKRRQLDMLCTEKAMLKGKLLDFEDRYRAMGGASILHMEILIKVERDYARYELLREWIADLQIELVEDNP